MKTLFTLACCLYMSSLFASTLNSSNPQSADTPSFALYGYVRQSPTVFVLQLSPQHSKDITQRSQQWELRPVWIDNNSLIISTADNQQVLRLSRMDLSQASLSGSGVTGPQLRSFVSRIPNSGKMLVNLKQNNVWTLYQVNQAGELPKKLSQEDGIYQYQVFWDQNHAVATLINDMIIIDLQGKFIETEDAQATQALLPSGRSDLIQPLLANASSSKMAQSSDVSTLNLIPIQASDQALSDSALSAPAQLNSGEQSWLYSPGPQDNLQQLALPLKNTQQVMF